MPLAGLKKLFKAMATGLLMALLASALDACAYLALRYFDVVPGCDISKDPASAVYVLEAGVAARPPPTTARCPPAHP